LLSEGLLDGPALHQRGADKIAQNGGDHSAPASGLTGRLDIKPS
jgi:hypothetical protein